MRTTLAVVWAIAVLTLLASCVHADEQVDRVHVISLVNLIATPGAYDGKWVSVVGVVQVRDDEPALFLSADDAAYGNLSNGIWLTKLGVSEERWNAANGKWVGVRGVFDQDSRGSFGLFAGSIRDIDRMDPLPAPEGSGGK